MIRRLLLVLAAGLLASSATLIPEPSPPAPALPAGVPPAPPTEAGHGVAYCPWAESTDQVDTVLGLASLSESSVTLSFPTGGESGPMSEVQLPGPAARAELLGEVVRRGDAPAVVEFSDGPSAAAAIISGAQVLSGDVCTSSIPKIWQLPGGSTRDGEQLTLRLFNPFPEDAVVDVAAVSEFGPEALTQLESISVAPRGWRDVDLSELLPLREQLGLTISIQQGLVIPGLELAAGDRASWPGIGRSATWEFPLVQAGDLSPVLAVVNPGPTDVPVEVDAVTSSAILPSVAAEVVSPGGEVRIPLGGLAEGVFGVRVRAEGPVSAVLVGQGSVGRAALPGARRPARRWVAPAFGALETARHSLWVMNSGSEPTTVTYRLLTPEGPGAPAKVSVPPGTVRRVLVEAPQGGGLEAEGLEPFSLAWSAELEGAVVYSAASPVDG